jgi:Asp-tRNA(Asn)/Glu-tRNA(Gln) amidotransferase A subunit family amidase
LRDQKAKSQKPANVHMSELTIQSASKLAELIKRREVSPVEVAEAYLRRIDDLNPLLNAIVTLSPKVLEQAREAEAALLRGDDVGPLHGVPLTIKDTIETAGLRSTSGSAIRASHIPETDAPAVARLKAAGAIILGKTNTAEMAMDYTADNPVFGRTNNPHDATRTPGGSSGGEAAAIATCMSAGGIGSDLAGSIRIPAHFCGIAGLKPGTGRVPAAGQFPPSAGPYSLGSAIGPMARHIADLHLLFSVLVGSACSVSSIEALQDRRTALSGQRVAWYTNDGVVPVTTDTRRAVESAARALTDAGLLVEEHRPPNVEHAFELWLSLFSRASVVQLRDVYLGQEEKAGAFVRWRLASADDTPPPTLADYIRAWLDRDRLRAELIEWMNATPLLLAPVGATPAFEHDAHKVSVDGKAFSTFRAFSYCHAFNVFDLPSVSVPAGRSREGLPIGVQIAGRPGEEETILAAALIVEEALSDKL